MEFVYDSLSILVSSISLISYILSYITVMAMISVLHSDSCMFVDCELRLLVVVIEWIKLFLADVNPVEISD